MTKVVIDFETYCDLDITEVGAHKYTDHPSCRILCLGHKTDEGTTGLWTPGTAAFPKIEPETAVYAFNATFEYLVWNKIGVRDFPEFFPKLNLSQVIDIQGLCGRFRIPQSLDKAAQHLNKKHRKIAAGKALIKLCCTPNQFPTKEHYRRLYEYCIGDVDASAEILDNLPADHLTPFEQRVWELTFKMNDRGVPVDIEATRNIIHYLAVYSSAMREILPEVTNGEVTTPGQVQRIKKFCASKGVDMPNVQAETIEKMLQQDGLPEDVKTVLEIRQLTGLSSVKKFITIDKMYNQGYVQGNARYHGAGTGRWTGQGLQYHNLPRLKHKNPEEWIEKFNNKEDIEKPLWVAKGLIRPMMKAPDGQMWIVSDYSSVENKGLAWANDDFETLALFKQGLCQYTDMAVTLYSKPYASISKDERQMGKVVILGCGYQMGGPRFQAVAADWGITLSAAQSKHIVNLYRRKYTKVVRGWRAGEQACLSAVRYPGRSFKALKSIFKVVQARNGRMWLRITLPSGRSLMYADPYISEGMYGKMTRYTGLNSKTHQMDKLTLTPGLITENIIQAMTRDILAQGKLEIEEKMPEVTLCLSVHDEAGSLINESDIHESTMDIYNKHLCVMYPWMEGFPLTAEGFIAKRYKKD